MNVWHLPNWVSSQIQTAHDKCPTITENMTPKWLLIWECFSFQIRCPELGYGRNTWASLGLSLFPFHLSGLAQHSQPVWASECLYSAPKVISGRRFYTVNTFTNRKRNNLRTNFTGESLRWPQPPLSDTKHRLRGDSGRSLSPLSAPREFQPHLK